MISNYAKLCVMDKTARPEKFCWGFFSWQFNSFKSDESTDIDYSWHSFHKMAIHLDQDFTL